MSRPVGGGFRRRREAEDPNNTWNMQLFTALLTKNFSEASNLLEKGANVNHMTANIISTNTSGNAGTGSAFDGASSPQQAGSPLGNNNSPGSPTGANLDNNNNNNKQGGNNNQQQAQSPQALALQQHQQKLVATFLKSGGTVPLCIALIFRASGVANYGEASPGGVSPATVPITDAIESLSWLHQNGCNLNAVVEPFATLSANQLQQLQQNNMPPTMTALQRSVNGTMFHMCVHFEWSETLEKLLALRIKLDYQQKQTEQQLEQEQEPTDENAEQQQGDENNNKKSKPEYLLSAGVVDRNGSSPSLLAVTSGKIEIAKILLRHLAPFDFLQKVDQEHTLLGRAATTNDVVLVEILLQLGDDPDQVDIETGRTLLQLTWSAFNRQNIDPSLALPGGAQVIGSSAAGGGAGAGTGKSGAQGAHTAINVFNPSQLLQQQQQTLAQQQQLLPPSALLSSAAQQGAAGGATTSNSKADKNDPNAGLQMQLMNVLLNRGYDINKPNVEGKTLMTYALDTLPRHLALSQLDTFVQNGGNIDAADAVTGRTLLMASVDTCDIELMRKLILDYKADVNARDAFGASALHRACGCGRRIGLAEQLLAYEQTNINLQDFDGQAPLHRAAARGRESTVKMLIGKEACDVNVADEDGNTPLHVAVEGGHFPIVDLLVSLNTNPRPVSAGNKRGGGGGGGGNKKKEQVEPNPNRLTVDAVNKDGHTALELAVKKMMEQQSSESTETVLKIVDKLMSGSASVHRVSADTKLSLLQQAVIARSSSLVDTFLSKSANIHHRCAKDKTALHYATENQDVQIVKNLLQAGAVVNAQDSFRLTAPLHIACADLHVELATIFIEQAGANVNITNDNFQTPLHIVCDCAGGDDTTPIRSNIGFVPSSSSSGSNHAETLERATAIGRLLLSKGARGNCADRWRRTPLHYAAASNAVELFRELLVKLSHQVWIKDENESTALHLACSHKATNVVEFICGLMETRHKTHLQNQNQNNNNNIVPRTSKEIVLVLENLIAQGQEKIAAGSSRAVKAGAAYARPSDPLIQMHRKKFDVENPIEGAASTAARNILEAEDISNELEGWMTGLKMKDKMGRTAMLLAAQAGSSEIGKLLSATQKVLMY